jgi:hypothetical protein
MFGKEGTVFDQQIGLIINEDMICRKIILLRMLQNEEICDNARIRLVVD